MTLTIGSLFSGIGGLELGLEQAGLGPVLWQVEIDPYCRTVLERHWPDIPKHDDIRTFPDDNTTRPDIICGGSPCQDLSVAGKRRGISGERSGLFLEMVRVIRELQPGVVVWENVRGAFSSNGGRDFRAVLGHFSDLGYDAEWTLLRASDFGLPHRRERVFLVAHKDSNLRQPDSSRQNRGGNTGSGGREELAVARCKLSQGLSETGTTSLPDRRGRGTKVVNAKCERAKLEPQTRVLVNAAPPPGPNETERWAAVLDEDPWLAPAVESGFCRMVDGVPAPVDRNRAKRLKALGNAVVPACARWVGERIAERLTRPGAG